MHAMIKMPVTKEHEVAFCQFVSIDGWLQIGVDIDAKPLHVKLDRAMTEKG